MKEYTPAGRVNPSTAPAPPDRHQLLSVGTTLAPTKQRSPLSSHDKYIYLYKYIYILYIYMCVCVCVFECTQRRMKYGIWTKLGWRSVMNLSHTKHAAQELSQRTYSRLCGVRQA